MTVSDSECRLQVLYGYVSDGIIILNLEYYVRQLELYFGFIPCGYSVTVSAISRFSMIMLNSRSRI